MGSVLWRQLTGQENVPRHNWRPHGGRLTHTPPPSCPLSLPSPPVPPLYRSVAARR